MKRHAAETEPGGGQRPGRGPLGRAPLQQLGGGQVLSARSLAVAAGHQVHLRAPCRHKGQCELELQTKVREDLIIPEKCPYCGSLLVENAYI